MIFLPYLIFTGIAISGFSFRQLLLALIGFFLPLLLVLVFFFWNNGHSETLQILPEIFTYKKNTAINTCELDDTSRVSLDFGFGGVFLQCGTPRLHDQSAKTTTADYPLAGFFSLIQFLLVKRQAAFQLLIFIPGLTYLITQFFLNMRRGMIAKLAFLILLFGLPVGGWWFIQTQLHANSTYFVKTQTGNLNTSGEKKSWYFQKTRVLI